MRIFSISAQVDESGNLDAYAKSKPTNRWRTFGHFWDAEAKRSVAGHRNQTDRARADENRDATARLFYARLCPFCRKMRGMIQSTSRKQFLPEVRGDRTARRSRPAFGEEFLSQPKPVLSVDLVKLGQQYNALLLVRIRVCNDRNAALRIAGIVG